MSDEERAREIAEHAGIDMLDDHDLFIAEMSAALAAVREAIRAKCEAIARQQDGTGLSDWSKCARKIAAAIAALSESKNPAPGHEARNGV